MSNLLNQSRSRPSDSLGQSRSPQNGASIGNPTIENETSWEVISLGLEEALPTQDVIDEL